MDILVASTSAHKLAAVKEAASVVFPGQELNVRGMKAASDINEQPVGHQETLLGANNRLRNLKRIAAQTRCDLYVSLENGIFPLRVGDQDTWFDVGWVVAEDAAGNQSLSHSTGIELGKDDVAEAQRRGFDKTTVGSIIAERTGADSTDPHSHLTGGHVSRSDMLGQALRATFGQHLRKTQILELPTIASKVTEEMKRLGHPYHNDEHVNEVDQRSDEIGSHVVPALAERKRLLLRLAAIYHDAGHAGVTIRSTSLHEVPYKNLSNEQYAALLMRQDLTGKLSEEELNEIEQMILSTTFGQTPHPHPASTVSEKVLVLADVGGFLKSFDEWVRESLLVLAEAPVSGMPADFEAWRKNRRGFLDGYLKGLVAQMLPHVDADYGAYLTSKLQETVRLVETDLHRFQRDFERVRASRLINVQ